MESVLDVGLVDLIQILAVQKYNLSEGKDIGTIIPQKIFNILQIGGVELHKWHLIRNASEQSQDPSFYSGTKYKTVALKKNGTKTNFEGPQRMFNYTTRTDTAVLEFFPNAQNRIVQKANSERLENEATSSCKIAMSSPPGHINLLVLISRLISRMCTRYLLTCF